jgi:hypothetical protein
MSRRVWWGFTILLAITVLAELVFPVDGRLDVDGWFGYAAVFGFAAGMVLILVVNLLGRLLGRPDGYYDD